MDKPALRLNVLEMRDMLSAVQVAQMSKKICTNALSMPKIKNSAKVGVYLSFRNEPDTAKLIENLLNGGKEVFAPVVVEGAMKFARLTGIENVSEGEVGVMEPAEKNFVDANSIEAFIIPGIAFDMRGYRLGWGGGHYDKFLSNVPKAAKIALSYEFEVVHFVPSEKHDIKMDFVVTEKRIIEF